MQPLLIGNSNRDGYTAAGGNDDLVCVICGKKGHKTCVPFFRSEKSELLCMRKFLSMSALKRCNILDDKRLCRRCLSSGAAKGHEYCSRRYMCKCTGHDSKTEGYHVLVCHKHKDTSDNTKLLNEFKDTYLQNFKDLPDN